MAQLIRRTKVAAEIMQCGNRNRIVKKKKIEIDVIY